MASFKVGSLTKDMYLEWIDMIEDHATDSGIWQYIDPTSVLALNQPKKPETSDYKPAATNLSDLNEDEKMMYREDNALYKAGSQSYRQEKRLIEKVRSEVAESLHEYHGNLILGCTSCHEAPRQIKDRLEPTEDLQVMKIIDDYAKIRIPPVAKKVENWLLE